MRTDFNFAVLMEPPTMAGAMIGTIINKNSPGAVVKFVCMR